MWRFVSRRLLVLAASLLTVTMAPLAVDAASVQPENSQEVAYRQGNYRGHDRHRRPNYNYRHKYHRPYHHHRSYSYGTYYGPYFNPYIYSDPYGGGYYYGPYGGVRPGFGFHLYLGR